MPSCSVRFRSDAVIPVLLFLTLFTTRVFPQPIDYDVIFGSDWQKAEAFVSDNEEWMRQMLVHYNISYYEAIAVIFPELVRYSALRDKMETVLLKTLYINLGDEYANFSIGVLQMKPSFAEEIREKAEMVFGRRAKRLFSSRASFKNDREYRASIVSDLEDPRKQLKYLIAFIKICEYNFELPEGTERIKFLATAYNFNFTTTQEDIAGMQEAKYFNTKIYKSECYSYSDVSLFWYKSNYSETAQ